MIPDIGVKNQNHQRHRTIKGIETAKAQKQQRYRNSKGIETAKAQQSKTIEVLIAMEIIEAIKTI